MLLRYRLILVLILATLTFSQTMVTPNPLTGLPSQPGSKIDSIKAMGDNEWLSLGAPAGDPKWGRAYGRSWGGQGMSFAPNLRGAFMTGEAYHADVKSTGYGLDDYWFYNINTNSWICLYPGTNIYGFNAAVSSGELSVNTYGNPVTKSGEPVPGHLLIHAWGYLTYDTDLNKFRMLAGASYGEYYMPGLTQIRTGLTALQSQGLSKPGYNFAPWAYDVATGKFERDLATNAPSFAATTVMPLFMYVPSKKEYFVGGSYGVSFFNPATQTWRNLADPGTGGVKGYDFTGCLDSKRNRIYMGSNASNFSYFDLNTEKWVKIANPAGYADEFSTTCASMCYDSVSDVILVFVFTSIMDTKVNKLYLFDPSTNQWVDVNPLSSTFIAANRGTNRAFYDPELGVYFIYTAGDSKDNGEMWVYKYRDKATVEREKTLTSIKLVCDASTVEKYLSCQLKIRQTYQTAATDTISSFVRAQLTSLTPSKITVTATGFLRALDTGTAQIQLTKNGFIDILTLSIVPSTATTDSVVILKELSLMTDETFTLSCTGYFHKGVESF